MANVILSQLALATKYQNELVETVNLAAAACRFTRFTLGGGPNVSWVLSTDGASGSTGTFAEGAAFNTYTNDPQIPATLQWARYGDNRFISGTALRVVQSGVNPNGNERLWFNKMNSSIRNTVSDVGKGFFTGDGTTNKIAGLDVALLDNNTYAGIDRTQSANALFRATVFDSSSTTPTTLSLIRSDMTAIEKKCNEKPNIGYVSFEEFDFIAGLFDPNRRYNQEVIGGGAEARSVLRYGADYVVIDGMVLIRDKNATANKIYYCNDKYINFEVMPPEQVPGDELGLAQGNDGLGPVGFGLMIKPLPPTGDNHIFAIMSELQLKVQRPNAMGCRINLLLS